MNDHDLDAFLACFHADYRSEQPAHPNRGFGGRDQVEKNWGALFAAIPDFHAALLARAVSGDEVWSEWNWTGRREDGSALDMRGVIVFRAEGGRIAAARLYMEDVEEAGADIDEAVRRMAGQDSE